MATPNDLKSRVREVVNLTGATSESPGAVIWGAFLSVLAGSISPPGVSLTGVSDPQKAALAMAVSAAQHRAGSSDTATAQELKSLIDVVASSSWSAIGLPDALAGGPPSVELRETLLGAIAGVLEFLRGVALQTVAAADPIPTAISLEVV